MIFGWDDAIGAVMAGAAGFIGASKQKSALNNLRLAHPQYGTIGDAQKESATQIYKLPQVADLLGTASGMDNAAALARIEADDPNAVSNTKATSALALNKSLGGLSQDTQDAIKRANAYSALMGGYAGSSMADTALGLRTAQARQRAIGEAPQFNSMALGRAEELAPVNPDVTATLISPAAAMQRRDQLEKHNADIRNQERLGDLAALMASSNMKGGMATTGIAGLMGGMQNLWGGGYNTPDPWGSAEASQLSGEDIDAILGSGGGF